MLTTLAGLWLIYFTIAANPPANGLLSPLPKSPSTTSVSALSLGGSRLVVISVNFTLFASSRRFLLARQSADSLFCTLKRYTLTSYPSSLSILATASASPPLLPGPAKTTTGVRLDHSSFMARVSALAARSIRLSELIGSCSMVYLSNS